jgi:hypothetical protein
MIWLLVAISIFAINVLAGRAYSRSLDRLEARSNPMHQFLNGLPLTAEQVEAANYLTERKRIATQLAPSTMRLQRRGSGRGDPRGVLASSRQL